jgi:SAM-dependent methyltransferase
MIAHVPDYKDLDRTGEAGAAAARMEARASEPASEEMFAQLIRPLLGLGVTNVLEVGCGTAALSRRVAAALPGATVYGIDKSQGMLAVAERFIREEGLGNVRLLSWDVTDEASFPAPAVPFDLILSSVVIPYLDDEQTSDLIQRLAARLKPGGVLAFMEQDLGTDTVHFPKYEILEAVLCKGTRDLKETLSLGLRPSLRAAGLELLPRRSFLWTSDRYGAYCRDLLERLADANRDRGRLTEEQTAEWKRTLEELDAAGDFYYGMVYHLVAGRKR